MFFLDMPPGNLTIDYAVVQEARAVHDMAMLKPADYVRSAGSNWIVAIVIPKPGSGSATVPGAYINAQTGEFVNPGNASAVRQKHGEWRAVAAAAGSTGPAEGTYAWNEPLDPGTRSLSPEDVFSPFAHGGTIVFRLEPSAEGIQRFAACRVMFAEWDRAMADALGAEPAVFDTLANATSAQLPVLERMISGSNSVLATLAVRTALETQLLPASRAAALLDTSDVRRLAIMVYLGIVAAPSADRSQWIASIDKLISETTGANRLLAVGYALFSAKLFAQQDANARDASRQLLGSLRQRVERLHIPVQRNAWSVILK